MSEHGHAVMMLDRARFPRAAAYLASLREGLDSHPACKVKDVVIEPYVRFFASVASEPGLPGPVADLLAGRLRAPWVPEVLLQVAHLAVRDRAFDADAPFFDWTQQAAEEVFDKPILRSLMRLVSPTLIVLGATKRWSAFHVGSELTADRVVEAAGRASTTAHLRHPAGSMSALFLKGLERSFVAALVVSRARDARVELASADEARGVADYSVSWRA